MLSNRSIDVIKICLETTLAITRGTTEGAEKARKDITETIKEFDEYITEIEDKQREFEENYNSYIEQ